MKWPRLLFVPVVTSAVAWCEGQRMAEGKVFRPRRADSATVSGERPALPASSPAGAGACLVSGKWGKSVRGALPPSCPRHTHLLGARARADKRGHPYARIRKRDPPSSLRGSSSLSGGPCNARQPEGLASHTHRPGAMGHPPEASEHDGMLEISLGALWRASGQALFTHWLRETPADLPPPPHGHCLVLSAGTCSCGPHVCV